MDRMGGISKVGRSEEVAKDEEMDKGDRVEKLDLLGDRVCSGSQSSTCSVGKKRQKVYPGVAMFDGRVAGDDRNEDRVAVDV